MDQDIDLSVLNLPLPEFLQEYCELTHEYEWIDENEPLFHLVRGLKAHEATCKLRPDQAYAKVMDAVERYRIPCLLEFGLDNEDGEVTFHSMWERVRFPLGTDPVEAACAMARDGVIRTQNKRPGRYSRFLTVAALVQALVRRRPLLLPVRKVAEHFPCQPNSVTSWVGWAIDDGVLLKTAEHAFRSQGHSRAAEYVFGLHCWNKEGQERLAKLLGVPLRPAVLQWTAEQFGEAQ